MAIPVILAEPDGRVTGLNRKATSVFPFFLNTNEPNNTVVVRAGAASSPIAMTIAGEGPALIYGLAYEGTYAFKLRMSIQDGNNIRPLMNGACYSTTILGTGFTPYPLPEPLYIDELRKLFIEITDLQTPNSGLTDNSVRLNFITSKSSSVVQDPTTELAQVRQNVKQFLSTPYFYTTDNGGLVTLTTTVSQDILITINPEYHFLLYQLSMSSTADFFIDLIDQASGDSLIGAPQGTHYGIDSRLIFGTGNYPFCLIEPYYFQLGQKIILRLQNQVSGTNNIYFTFGGRSLADRLWR